MGLATQTKLLILLVLIIIWSSWKHQMYFKIWGWTVEWGVVEGGKGRGGIWVGRDGGTIFHIVKYSFSCPHLNLLYLDYGALRNRPTDCVARKDFFWLRGGSEFLQGQTGNHKFPVLKRKCLPSCDCFF